MSGSRTLCHSELTEKRLLLGFKNNDRFAIRRGKQCITKNKALITCLASHSALAMLELMFKE